MLVALSMIFLGIKRYRDKELGGVIKFLPALALGLGIAAMAGVIYVVVWEIYLAASGYHFMDSYVAGIIAAKRAHAMSGAALAAEIAKLEEMKAQYANPLFRVPMTFLEIFPVGLIVALISAAVLRFPQSPAGSGLGAHWLGWCTEINCMLKTRVWFGGMSAPAPSAP